MNKRNSKLRRSKTHRGAAEDTGVAVEHRVRRGAGRGGAASAPAQPSRRPLGVGRGD